MAYNHQNGNNGVPLNGYANQQQQHNLAMQPQYAEEAAPPVLTGVAGMQIINEMFQRQARRLETQQQAQAQDRNTVEYTQAQLLVMQAQLQWHASRYQERAEHVTKSAETISRMQNYLGTMDAERARAVETAKILANDVNGLRQRMETSQPEKLQALSLSDMAMRGTDLTSLDGIGQLFVPGAVPACGAQGASSSAASGATSASGASNHGHHTTLETTVAAALAQPHGPPPTTSSSSHHMERRRSSRHSNNDNHGQSNSASGASGSHHSTSGSSHQLSNGSGSDGAEDGEASSSFSKHGNGGDNSSSDSADAASAALTQRRAHVGDRVATRRSGQHLAHVKGSSTLVPTREGSPPENDSASGDSNNGSNDATQSNGGTGSAASHEQKRAGSGGSGGGGSGSNSDENASGDSPPHESASVPGLPQQGPVSAAPPLPVAPINPVGMVQQGVVGVLPTAGAQGVPPTSTQGLLEHLPPHLQQMLHRLPPANQSTFAQAASASLLPAQGIHAYGGAQGNGGNGVLQGVLPFPGQGVVELQQGVIVGGALEEFRGQATQQNALAAHQQGVLGGDGTAIPFQMPQAQHAMPRVAPIASATVARSEDNGFTGEPPAKRAAASTLDASGMVVDGAEEPAKGVTAPRHTRAEFGCEGGGTATAAQPAPTAMDESR